MRKTLVVLSVSLNAVIVLLVIALAVAGSDLLVRLFIQPAHERWVSQFEHLPVEPGDIVFLGDSITEGGNWHEWFPGLPVRNRGIGGDTTDGVLQRLHQVTDDSPAKVLLLIGTNDLAMGAELTTIVANIGEIVTRIRRDSPATVVVVQSILPRHSDYRGDIERINAGLRQRLGDSAVWVDLYPLMLDARDGSIRDDLSNDELHLLGAGYQLWREALSPVLSGYRYDK